MIAANEAVATLLSERSIPALYRVHERPEPRSALRLVEQLASLDVATPPVPEPLAPSQAADDRRAVRGAGRPARAPHRPRPPGAHDARAALAQAGALLAREPRPRRPAVDALLPLHLAHPPLPRPRLPPGAAQRRGRRGGRAARRHARRGGRVDVGARARRDGHRARRRRRRPLLPARARHVRRRLGHGLRRRDHGPDRRGRLRRPSATATRACCRSAACAATGGSSTSTGRCSSASATTASSASATR